MRTLFADGNGDRAWRYRCLRNLVACLCIAVLASDGVESRAALSRQGGGADLCVNFGSGDFSGYQTVVFDIFNDGPDEATDVVFHTPTPPNVDFLAVRIDFLSTVPLRCTTPPSGQRGDVDCVLGSIPANSTVSVRVDYDIELAPGTELPIAALVTASNETNLANNSLEGNIVVPFPPTVDTVADRHGSGQPYSIEITGEHLDIGIGNFGYVGIGCDCNVWQNAREVSSTRLVLEGGKELKRLFPKGVPVKICLSSQSGTTTAVTFTR